MKRLLIFKNETRQYSVDLAFVKSIHGTDVIRKEGLRNPVMQVNGHKIPLIDLSFFIRGDQTGIEADSGKIMLFDSQYCSFALKVDQIERIISAEDDQIESMPHVFKGHSLSCFPYVLKQDNAMILMISPDGMARKLFPETCEEIDGQQEFYPDIAEFGADNKTSAQTESAAEMIRIPEIEGDAPADLMKSAEEHRETADLIRFPETGDDYQEADLTDDILLSAYEPTPEDISGIGVAAPESDINGIEPDDIFPDIRKFLTANEPPEPEAASPDDIQPEDDDVILLTEEIEIPETAEPHIGASASENTDRLSDMPQTEYVVLQSKEDQLETFLIQTFQKKTTEERLFQIVSEFFKESVIRTIEKHKQLLADKP